MNVADLILGLSVGVNLNLLHCHVRVHVSHLLNSVLEHLSRKHTHTRPSNDLQLYVKSFQIHKAHRAALISISLALSQTPVYTARPRILG